MKKIATLPLRSVAALFTNIAEKSIYPERRAFTGAAVQGKNTAVCTPVISGKERHFRCSNCRYSFCQVMSVMRKMTSGNSSAVSSLGKT